jgi:predicted dehydrogenase
MKITRRNFLKTSIAVPMILPSAVWAAETAPSDRIRVGFIGTGKQSHHLLDQFMPRSQVVAVCDVDTTRREFARNKVDAFYTNDPKLGSAGCKMYVDYKELLARNDIDVVCIATPDHQHAEIILDALRSGKDVYCEKPLTHDIWQAVQVIKEVNARGRVLQTGSMQRSMWEFRVACELARNGAIGKIDRIATAFGDPSIPCDLPEEPMEPGLDWNRWVGLAQMRPYNSVLSPRGVHDHYPNWRNYQEFGGGMVCDWGAHHVDIAQWALGMDESGPVKVIPPADKTAKRGARLIYENGIEVIHGDGIGVHIFGTEGQIMVDRGKFVFILGDKTIAKFTCREDGGSLESKLMMVENEYLKDAKIHLRKPEDGHVGDFLHCVKSRKKPITHEGIGGRSAICCHLINMAYHHGQTMQWDPIKCEFAGGTGDPKWLTGSRRDYRNYKEPVV